MSSDDNISLPVDLSSCAAEPIHIIGRIQSFGYLIAFSSDWIINHLSANCAELFGRSLDRMIGTPANELIAPQTLHEIRSRLQMIGSAGAVDRLFGVDLTGSGKLFDLAVHSSDRSFVVEAEPAAANRKQDYVSYVRPMVDRMRDLGSVNELCHLAARQLRGLTGFDRVMVYRFEHDGAGEVVAESRNGRVDSFLGLHFPASDIPAQARRLYTRNMLRIISDVDDPTVPILPAANPSGAALDLSMSGLRAVSPIHIEYLRNMGVKASMSVSILRNGELWGLMACHHYSPLRLDYAVRTACELFGEFMSFLLEQTELRQINMHKNLAMRLHDEIMGRVAPGASMIHAFDGFAESIAKVIPFDSIAGWIGGELVGHGTIPNSEQFAKLARFLNTTGASQVWHSDSLASAYPPAAEFDEACTGIMSLPVSRRPRDYIVLFRKAQVQTVNWAGNPHKPIEPGPNGARLTPRKSFDLWKEERRGFAIPWTEEEVSTSGSLRITLLEVVLRMNDAAQQERDNASKKQETLIAELNHRVRNILNLIRGLVAQSKDTSRSTDEFTEVIGNRIYALARAHDQVTRLNWGPASLHALLRAECEAYVGDKLDRIVISGSDVLVEPAAYSTLALVFHELMTNSCKYGSLSDSSGHVAVSITPGTASGADIVWSEHGGPAVQEPRRRGFGSTIIANSIPHELGGGATVHFEPQGLVAEFSLPAQHIASIVASPDVARPAQPRAEAVPDSNLLTGDVLIVEDNLIIAMEAEDKLHSLGANRCHVAGNVTAALDIARKTPLSFALLDVNLGAETSEAVAAYLIDNDVPFVVASGYGEDTKARPALAQAISVMKPFSLAELVEAVSESLKTAR
jgi:light-regulated signal transduction histidine kinase (bacteriophytochrome)/CheY-like chemotaxis protein